jgi:hypothetical protein
MGKRWSDPYNILGILGWDHLHLYEFRIHDRVYAHLVFFSEDDLFVEAPNPCVGCDIPIQLLSLAVSDVFAYILDYGDYHMFASRSSMFNRSLEPIPYRN